MVRWSYGYRYLLAPDLVTESSKLFVSESTPLLTPYNHDRSQSDAQSHYFSPSPSTSSLEPTRDRMDRHSLHSVSRELSTSFPAVNVPSPADIPSHRITSLPSSNFHRLLGIMNPPLLAVFASVIIALITPLQEELFFNPTGFLNNSLILAIDTAGAVAIPLILTCLGASLVKSLDIIEDPATPAQVDSNMERRGIFLALFSRMALVPVIMWPFLITVMYFGVKYSPPPCRR